MKVISSLFLFVLFFGQTYGFVQTEQAEIKANAKAYEEAFNNRDIPALTSFWKENATYTRPDAKDVLEGREEIIAKMTEGFGKNKVARLTIQVNRVIIPEKGKAIEIGSTLYTDNNTGETTRTAYKSNLVKENGKWLIQDVREMINKIPPSHYEYLQPLEWFIGDWSESDEDVDVKINFSWDKTKNFIKQKIAITTYGQDSLEISRRGFGSQCLGSS